MHIAEAETEEKKTGCYRHTEMQRDLIIEKLKEKGFRITRQRKILLDIILEGECSCCKEIYYRAFALDPGIGVATVYRMINTLESIGAISRKNMYRVACSTKGACAVELDDDTICHLSAACFALFAPLVDCSLIITQEWDNVNRKIQKN